MIDRGWGLWYAGAKGLESIDMMFPFICRGGGNNVHYFESSELTKLNKMDSGLPLEL